jgi:hypothetical protein
MGKTKLQKIAFLIQMESKLDFYDFRRQYYGPHSRDLDNDILSHPELIDMRVSPNLAHPERISYMFRVTDKGFRIKKELEKGLDERRAMDAESALRRCSAMPMEQLLDKVYANYVEFADKRLPRLEEEIELFRDNVQHVFEKHYGWQSFFMSSMLGYVRDSLVHCNKLVGVHKSVIACLAAEFLESCEEEFQNILQPDDSNRIGTALPNVTDVWCILVEYCQMRGMRRNPYEFAM